MDVVNISSSVHGNGIGMAPSHYGLVYHVCRQVSAHVRYLCHLSVWRYTNSQNYPLRRISPLSPTWPCRSNVKSRLVLSLLRGHNAECDDLNGENRNMWRLVNYFSSFSRFRVWFSIWRSVALLRLFVSPSLRIIAHQYRWYRHTGFFIVL